MRSGATPNFTRHSQGVIQPRAEINRILYILSNTRGLNGIDVRLDINGGMVIDGSNVASPQFSGTAYVAGVRTTGLDSDSSKPWVKCDISTGIATEETGPPSNPFPNNEEWYEKAQTAGDIHVPRV